MRRFSTLAFGLALAALGCSGGGGGSQVAGGGVGGTGISSGSVTGFGSFIVTGTAWSLDASGTVEIDGATGDAGGGFDESDLALGMYLEVEGRRRTNGKGNAASVRFDEAVRGAVEQTPMAISGDQASFTVLGQVVVIDQGLTVFDGTSFETLGLDDFVEISGPVLLDGSIRATRVERLGSLVLGATEVEFKGVVASAGGGVNGSFEIGPVLVQFDCTAATDCTALTGGFPQNGDRVEVEAVQTAAGMSPEVDALLIRPFTPFAADLGDVENLELEGPIDDFASLASFRVNGVMVDASAAELDPNTPAAYVEGVYVEVEGDVEGGVLQARRLELEEGSARVSARIPSGGLARRNQGELIMLLEGSFGQEGSQAVVVEVDASTRLEDDVGGDDDLDFAELLEADYLEIRGVSLADGRMRATEIKRREVDDVELRGPVEAVDTNPDGGVGYTALGVFVEMVQGITDVDETGDDVLAFLNGLSLGEVLEARDDEDGSEDRFDIADDVERE